MHSQQQAESEMLGLYGRMVTLVLVLIILGFLGWRYFNGVEDVRSQSLTLEHRRLITTLPMIRSQWLSSGRPHSVKLEWQEWHGNEVNTVPASLQAQDGASVLMSASGWPQLVSLDKLGCERLWLQLLGSSLTELKIVAAYQADNQSCRYSALDGSVLTYQQTTGEVVFWRAGEN
jgi:hypothetical protein